MTFVYTSWGWALSGGVIVLALFVLSDKPPLQSVLSKTQYARLVLPEGLSHRLRLGLLLASLLCLALAFARPVGSERVQVNVDNNASLVIVWNSELSPAEARPLLRNGREVTFLLAGESVSTYGIAIRDHKSLITLLESVSFSYTPINPQILRKALNATLDLSPRVMVFVSTTIEPSVLAWAQEAKLPFFMIDPSSVRASEANIDIVQRSGGKYLHGVNENLFALLDKTLQSGIEAPTRETLMYYEDEYAFSLLVVALGLFVVATLKLPRIFSSLIAVIMIMQPLDMKAGVFDFITIERALSAYKKGEYTAAAKLYEELNKESSTPQGEYNLANCYYQLGEWGKAEKIYAKNLYKLDIPFQAKVTYNYANTLAQLGRYEEAIEWYKYSLRLRPHKDAETNLVSCKELLVKKKGKRNSVKGIQAKINPPRATIEIKNRPLAVWE